MPGRRERAGRLTAAPWVPAHATLRTLQRAVQDCEGCDLFRHATRAVFGEGPAAAPLVLVTVHPSALLRAPDEATRRTGTARFVDDLRVASNWLAARVVSTRGSR